MKQSEIERLARAICLAGKHATFQDVDAKWPNHIPEAEAAERVIAGTKRNWVVGITKHQQEQRAAAELREQGYIVYLPKLFVRQHDGRRATAFAQLRFPGYALISLDLTRQEHGPISHTKGMDGSDGPALIMDGPLNPATVRTKVVEDLRQIEDLELARALAKKLDPRDDLFPGDRVRFIGDRNHPAFGLEGIYMGNAKRGIAIILAGWKEWQVPQSDLRRIEKQERKAA